MCVGGVNREITRGKGMREGEMMGFEELLFSQYLRNDEGWRVGLALNKPKDLSLDPHHV